jgi:hypothetical protein
MGNTCTSRSSGVVRNTSTSNKDVDDILSKLNKKNKLNSNLIIEDTCKQRFWTYRGGGKKKVPRDVRSISIHSSVSKIPAGSFSYCPALTTIDIKPSLVAIEEDVFNGCTSLKEIVLPPSVQEIGQRAFYNCASLRDVRMESTSTSNITHIGDEAFLDCKTLMSIKLPSSLTAVGKYAFFGCTNLKSVTFESGSSIETIEPSTFGKCSSLTNINIPEGVVSIKRNAFHKCTSLESIDLPQSLTLIENDAFNGCCALKLVQIPSSVKDFAMDAFRFCSALQFIDIHPLVQIDLSASLYAFQDCSSLKSISLPKSLKHIPTYAFKDCASLLSIYIPPTVASIGDGAFSGCLSLSSIIIPQAVQDIGASTFRNCRTLLAAFQRSSFYNPDDLNIYDDFIAFLKNRYHELPLHEQCYNYPNGNTSLKQIKLSIIGHKDINSGFVPKKIIKTNDGFGISPLHVLALNPNSNMKVMKNVLSSFHPAQQSILLKEMNTLQNGVTFTPLELYLQCKGLSQITLNDALKQGMPWMFIRELFELQKSSIVDVMTVNEIDETNGLYPFMIAGSQSNCDLETAYNLALSSTNILATL